MADHVSTAMIDAVARLERVSPPAGISVSTRSGGGMLIVWGGTDHEPVTAEQVVYVARDGGIKGRAHHRAPDWTLHHAIYHAQAEVHAVVHVQSTHATALASLRRSLPAFHPRIAVAGGDSVPCVPYQRPGSAAWVDAVIDALAHRNACLIAHDGLVSTGGTLTQAISIAISIEFLCHSYLAALSAGEPPRLDRSEIVAALEQQRSYARTPRG